MKIDFPVYILHALHVLHGKIKYSVLNFMTFNSHYSPLKTQNFDIKKAKENLSKKGVKGVK